MTFRRRIFDLYWSPKFSCWQMRARGSRDVLRNFHGLTKATAVQMARGICREIYDLGALSQLVVHNRDGTISFESTYGRDPKRRKG